MKQGIEKDWNDILFSITTNPHKVESAEVLAFNEKLRVFDASLRSETTRHEALVEHWELLCAKCMTFASQVVAARRYIRIYIYIQFAALEPSHVLQYPSSFLFISWLTCNLPGVI